MADRLFISELQVDLRLPATAAMLLKHFDTQMPTFPPPENKPALLPPGLFDSQMYLLISEIVEFCLVYTLMFCGLTGSAVQLFVSRFFPHQALHFRAL